MGSEGDAYGCDYAGAALRLRLTLQMINALAESVIGLFKTEVIRRAGPWTGLDDVEITTLAWVW